MRGSHYSCTAVQLQGYTLLSICIRILRPSCVCRQQTASKQQRALSNGSSSGDDSSSRESPERVPSEELISAAESATYLTSSTIPSKQIDKTQVDQTSLVEDIKYNKTSVETRCQEVEPRVLARTQEYAIKTYTCQPINKMDVREALVGTNKKFECQVIGFPPPNIRWFKDNAEITHDPRYHFSHNHEDGVVSMHIEVIKLSDAGMYQCRAENCEGYAITAAHLQVKGW